MRTFMHHRKYDRHAQIEARGGLTIAIEQVGRELKYAIAECSRKDNFERKAGRIKAEGRLNSQGAISLPLGDDVDLTSPTLATYLKSLVFNQADIQKKVAKLRAGGK